MIVKRTKLLKENNGNFYWLWAFMDRRERFSDNHDLGCMFFRKFVKAINTVTKKMFSDCFNLVKMFHRLTSLTFHLVSI